MQNRQPVYEEFKNVAFISIQTAFESHKHIFIAWPTQNTYLVLIDPDFKQEPQLDTLELKGSIWILSSFEIKKPKIYAT